MRIVRLVLLGLVAFLVTGLVRFPAAPVVERIRPELGPVALEGVEGALIDGRVARVRSTDDLLPLEFSDVSWSLAPLALPRGAGANVTFEGYGGGGEGRVLRAWNGDVVVESLAFTAEAKALEPLLPAPIAAFAGRLAGDISRVVLEAGLLTTFEGTLSWSDAVLERPVPTVLGRIDVSVAKEGEDAHVATLAARGGDVAAEGTVRMTLSGDFVADLLLTPADSASPELIGVLQRIARPEGGGRYRLRQSGDLDPPM